MFLIISHSVHLRMRNISDKKCRENKKKHNLCSITSFTENQAVYSFKELLFALYWHIIVDIRANFCKAVNISLNSSNKTCGHK